MALNDPEISPRYVKKNAGPMALFGWLDFLLQAERFSI